jgi:hypothetical protein
MRLRIAFRIAQTSFRVSLLAQRLVVLLLTFRRFRGREFSSSKLEASDERLCTIFTVLSTNDIMYIISLSTFYNTLLIPPLNCNIPHRVPIRTLMCRAPAIEAKLIRNN